MTVPPVRGRCRRRVYTAAPSHVDTSPEDSPAVQRPAGSGLPAVPDRRCTAEPPSRRHLVKQAAWSPAAGERLSGCRRQQRPDSDSRNSAAAAEAGRCLTDDQLQRNDDINELVKHQSPRHSYEIRCHLIFSHLHP